ncbi:MAG: FAD:protein FMN transferase [Acidimicrobiales bacterium]
MTTDAAGARGGGGYRPGPEPGDSVAASAGAGEAPLRHDEQVMGTVVSFTVVRGQLPVQAAWSAIRSACAGLRADDAIFSTWDHRSPLSRLRRGEITLSDAPAVVRAVLEQCKAARQASDGWFDPWAMPGGVDPTGLVKGWAVERALAVLRDAGAAGAMVNGGGDIAAFGRPGPDARWRVGIRHPWRPDGLACVVQVDTAIATSGSYERGPHLIDPRTGHPTCGVASATVTGPSLALADALATALAVGGGRVLASVGALEGYGAYLIGADGSEADIGPIVFVGPEEDHGAG